MLQRYLKSDKRTLSLLQQCHLTMTQIHQIHAHLLVSGAAADPYAAAKLAAFCALSDRGDLRYAHLILEHTPQPSTFVWNTLIRAHADRDDPIAALSLYKRMLSAGFLPNNYTFSFLLKASLGLSSISNGRMVHTQAVKLGWESYDYIQNGLIHMYVTCGCVDSARKLFDWSSSTDVITWTAMINGYCKSRLIDAARELFDQMPERNAVSWSAMITTYAQIGFFREALEMFNDMQLSGVRPNHAGVIGALSACAALGALDQGRWIHAFAERNGMELDRILGTALVDMYCKCGCIEMAWSVFEEMPERDVFAYTAMISGFSNHGRSDKAIGLRARMRAEGVTPNEATFICILSACSRTGMVEEGREIFDSMAMIYGITPGIEHYGCLVDLLGHAGLLEEAVQVVREMPMEPDSYVLGALLNACRVHGDVELGKDTADSLVELGIDHSGVHVLMSNMYAWAHKWEDVAKVRKEMEQKNVRKVPGGSMIEIGGTVHEFVAGDRSHWCMEEIRSVLKAFHKQLKSFSLDCHSIIFQENLDSRNDFFTSS